MNLIKPGFAYDVVQRRKADGSLVSIHQRCKNLVPREGLNVLTSSLKGGAGPAALYMGLWSGAHTPNGEETAANFLTLVTEVTAYAQPGRLQVQLGAVADGATSNEAALARYDMNDAGVINGAFITTTQAKGSSGGTMFSVVRFNNPRPFDGEHYFELMAAFQMVSLSN